MALGCSLVMRCTMDVKAKLLELCKQAIGLNIGNEEEYKLGGSRFGGVPVV